MNKIETLSKAQDARVEEVMYYQINIDNYTLAIEEIDKLQDLELSEFKQQLQAMLASEILEQKKARVLLTVIQKQLESLA